MTLRTLGFALTLVAVLALLTSAVRGMIGADDSGQEEEPRVALVDPPRERIRVEVLNAAGVTGLARQVTEELRTAGFDVVTYGNAGALARDSTTIFDRSGNRGAVEALSAAIDITRIEEAVDTTLYLEVTLVLGGDWGQ